MGTTVIISLIVIILFLIFVRVSIIIDLFYELLEFLTAEKKIMELDEFIEFAKRLEENDKINRKEIDVRDEEKRQ